MNEEKDADYYFEKLKGRGLDKEKYYSQVLNPTHKYDVFPNEKIFMNWLIEGFIVHTSEDIDKIYNKWQDEKVLDDSITEI